VAVVVNGVVSSAEEIYRNGSMLSLEPELFKEITVQRGPAESFRYTSGAMGGTIEAQTKSARDFLDPGDPWAIRQKFAYESNGDGLLSSTILSFAPDDNFDVIGFYGYRDVGDRTDGAGTEQFKTGFEQRLALVEANYRLSDASRLTFHISYNDLPQFDVPYSAFSPSFSDVLVDRQVEDTTAYIEYNYNPLDNDRINLDVRLTFKQEDMRITSESTASDIYNTAHSNTRTAISVNNESLFQIGQTSHTLNVGVEFSERERSSEELAGTFAGFNARSAPGGTDEAISVYVTDEIKTGRLTVTPQLRFERQTLTSQGNDFAYTAFGRDVAAIPDGTQIENSAWTGAIAARYELTDTWSVFGTAAYNENLPILDDLRSATFADQSEKGRTFELGAAYDGFDVITSGDALKAKLTVFETQIWDGTTYRGVDEVDLSGAELELSYVHPAFYMDLNAGTTRGTINGTDDYFKHVPADQLQLTLGKRFMDEQLDLALEIRHAWANDRTPDTNPQFAPGTVPSEKYTVANFTASYKPATGLFEGVEFRGAIDNLFDEEYRPYLATRNAIGRNIKLSIAKTF
jgi:hemoglobin/transferrin/lactoferrin receptor protein